MSLKYLLFEQVFFYIKGFTKTFEIYIFAAV